MPIAAVCEHLGETVHVAGLVETVRDHKQVQFLVLRDGTGAAQIVRNKSDRQMLAPPLLTLGSAVEVVGTAVDAPAVKLGGIEIVARELIVQSTAAAPLPVSHDSALEKQFEFRQVSLRDPRQQLTFRVQTTVEQAMRAFWAERGFIEIHSPKLMGTFSESGAEAFEGGLLRAAGFPGAVPTVLQANGNRRWNGTGIRSGASVPRRALIYQPS